MDLNKLILRARSILVAPRTEWPVIAAEPADIPDLYRNYIAVLAAIGPVCGFIKTSLIGYAWHGFRVYRRGMGSGLSAAVVEYLFLLIVVYVLPVIVDALAPNFAGQPNRLQAMKAIGYSYTAFWVAGAARLLPGAGLAGLIGLAGAIYSAYLLYLGLPHTMKVPTDRAAPYAAVAVIIALVIGWIVGVMTASFYEVSVPDSLD